jgi:glycosyltransferase involved in cell wall biosynthesis
VRRLHERTPPIAWVVPGPLRQVTGGYLYDARIVDGLRAGGQPVDVLDVQVTHWPLDAQAGRRLVRGLGMGSTGRQRAGLARMSGGLAGPHPWGAVVVDELAHPALVAAILAGRLRRVLAGAPLVLLVHHLRCSEPAPWPTRLLALAVEAVAVRAADLLICTSETTARTVRPLAHPGVAVAVVRPGWDTHHERNALLPPNPLSHLWERGRGSGGEGTLRLLLVGHWTPRKGILDALVALGRVSAGVTLDLVGEQDRDPAYAARVQAALCDPMLAGRVRVHGRLSDAALAALYQSADALLLPSSHEGYGMVLAEALAAGLPMIASRVGAVPEVVRDGLEAALVARGDVAAMAQAIQRLADAPADRAARSRLALERARGLPTWETSIAAFACLLAGLTGRATPDQSSQGHGVGGAFAAAPGGRGRA